MEKRGDPNRRRREGGTLNASSSGGAAKDGGRDRGVRGKEGDVEEICNWGRIVKRGESESEEGKKGWRKRPIRSISALRCH